MNSPVRLVQLYHPKHHRRVAIVQEPQLVLLKDVRSIYDLAFKAIQNHKRLEDYVSSIVSNEKLEYGAVYNGEIDWKLLPSFDHPGTPFGCIVSGTGLTHKNSALNRQIMHNKDDNAAPKLTDSMIMYQWGVEGGNPPKGTIGVQPEWFYKGNGLCLRAHGQTLEVPAYANDGGEEPEIVGIYIIDEEKQPWRIGFTTGNEFSDHVMEKKNYLYLAPSKLRQCSIGPELIVTNDFSSFEGRVAVSRKEKELWSSVIHSGQSNMSHSLENMEYHHFKYAQHRIPLQAHVHYFGADAFSYGNGIKLEDGDSMHVEWKGMGRPLKNTIKVVGGKEEMLKIKEA